MTGGGPTLLAMAGPYAVRALATDTWPAFARLVEANNGVWGGCWCMGFHVKLGNDRTRAQNRAEKEERVRAGSAHAALVMLGDDCLGWCQFGSPAELPEVKSRRRARRRVDRDRPARRGHRRGLPRGDGRQKGGGVVPPHGTDGRLRESWLHPKSADIAASMGRHTPRRSGTRRLIDSLPAGAGCARRQFR